MSAVAPDVPAGAAPVGASAPAVLVLGWQLPFPPDQGGRIRSFHLLRALAGRARVTVIAFGEGADAALAERRLGELGVDVRAVARPPWAPDWSWHLRCARPLLAGEYPAGPLAGAAAAAQARQRYDLVIADGLLAAPAGFALRASPVLYAAHNVESEIYRRSIALGRGPRRRRVAARLDCAKLARFERRVARRCSAIVAVSARDAAILHRWAPRAETHVVPNGVDVESFGPLSMGPERGGIVFTGTLDYPPNRDAVLFFGREIFPRIKHAVPAATWRVVGRGGDDLQAALRGQPGIEFTGYVDDVRPHVARAEVVVVPLRAGGGTRLKILEAMALERPVVSTALGAEGLDLVHDEDLLIADDPAGIAAAVTGVLSDPDRAGRMAARARRAVVARYDWRDLGRRYTDVALRLAASGVVPSEGARAE
jgi:glycosyltransferase involved in cell wall biosynthesis